MKREQYIYYRANNLAMEIIYEAIKEVANFQGTFHDFMFHFTSWLIPGPEKQHIFEMIQNYYDVKFNIVLVSFNNNLIKIQ